MRCALVQVVLQARLEGFAKPGRAGSSRGAGRSIHDLSLSLQLRLLRKHAVTLKDQGHPRPASDRSSQLLGLCGTNTNVDGQITHGQAEGGAAGEQLQSSMHRYQDAAANR